MDSKIKMFMTSVYKWMFVAMAITGVTAYLFSSVPELQSVLYNIEPLTGKITSYSVIGWIVMFLPLAFVIFMCVKYKQMSTLTMQVLFILFSICIGASMSSIFLAYSITNISSAFFITAGTFFIMTIVGMVTKRDLTNLGSIMLMALIGLILAIIVNIFMHSSALDFLISIAGVVIFICLIAYDTQKLKNIATSGVSDEKAAIWGAMDLYLDFINLFQFILSLFGGSSND